MYQIKSNLTRIFSYLFSIYSLTLLSATCSSNQRALRMGETAQQTVKAQQKASALAPLPATFQVLVKDTRGVTQVINDVTSQKSVGWLKEQLYDQTGIAPSLQQLRCQNVSLANDAKRLQDYGITRSNTSLELSLTIKGGKVLFSAMNDGKAIERFSVECKTVWRGFNLRGKCTNRYCCSQKDKRRGYVWSCLGFNYGKDMWGDKAKCFNIATVRHRAKCPECGSKLDKDTVQECGFYQCWYKFTGHPLKGVKVIHDSGDVNSDDYFYCFGKDKLCLWDNLEIIVKRCAPYCTCGNYNNEDEYHRPSHYCSYCEAEQSNMNSRDAIGILF